MSTNTIKNPQARIHRLGARWGWGCGYCGAALYHPRPRAHPHQDPCEPWFCGGAELRLEKGRQPATIDHLVPRSRGGGHEDENLTLSCRSCNEAKDDLTLWTYPVEPASHRLRAIKRWPPPAGIGVRKSYGKPWMRKRGAAA